MKSIIPTLAVADIDASVCFYTEVLGFDIAFTLPGEDGKLIHASVQRGDSSLMFGRVDSSNPHDQGPLGRGVVLYATVADNEDIDVYFQRVKDAGATVVQEPTDQFWGIATGGSPIRTATSSSSPKKPRPSPLTRCVRRRWPAPPRRFSPPPGTPPHLSSSSSALEEEPPAG